MSETIGGRYRLEERLGAGGMAQVWLAHDTQLDRQVALKLLGARRRSPALRARGPGGRLALPSEHLPASSTTGARTAGRTWSSSILPGGTLEDRLAAGKPLDDAESERIAAEVAAGLAHAHDRGLIHRDLKPTNIVFDEEGRAKIADFGIARVTGAGHAHRGGDADGHRRVHVAGAGAGGAGDARDRRLLVRGHPLPDAGGAAPVRVAERRRGAAPASSRRRRLRWPPLRPDAPAALAAVAESSLWRRIPAERPPDGGALVELLGGGVAPTLVAGGTAR